MDQASGPAARTVVEEGARAPGIVEGGIGQGYRWVCGEEVGVHLVAGFEGEGEDVRRGFLTEGCREGLC